MTILKMVTIICIILISSHLIHYSVVQDGWVRLDIRWARPQEADSQRHPNPKYNWKTSCCPGRRYRDYSAPSAHSLPGRTWRPQAGFRRWLYYVVCQHVGDGMVTRFVIKSDGCGTYSNGVKGAIQIFIIFIIFVIWFTITNNENNENNWIWKR